MILQFMARVRFVMLCSARPRVQDIVKFLSLLPRKSQSDGSYSLPRRKRQCCFALPQRKMQF
jgi:hypothetical protein